MSHHKHHHLHGPPPSAKGSVTGIPSALEIPATAIAAHATKPDNNTQAAAEAASGSGNFFDQPFSVLWRKGLVSIPRLVPDSVLKYTAPDGPQPIILKIPSHGKHHIPVYVFVPHAPNSQLDASTAEGASTVQIESTIPVTGVKSSKQKSDKNQRQIQESGVSTVKPGGNPGHHTHFKHHHTHDLKATPTIEGGSTSALRTDPTITTAENNLTNVSTNVRASAKETSYKSASTRQKMPVLVDFHGGSFITGSCQEQAPFCAQMARELDCVVISVDYRLGPYDKYPAANEDAQDVMNAILDPTKPAYEELRNKLDSTLRKQAKRLVELDIERIALSGFSSGGNLALGLMLSIKNDPTINSPWPSPIPASFARDIPVLLFYPSLDCRMLPAERPRPPGLDPEGSVMKAMQLETQLMPTYLPVEKRPHPRASPGLVDMSSPDGSGLHDRARMLLVLPELDTLSEQSGVWTKKVQAEGRGEHLTVEKVGGVVHGWTQFPDSWLTKHDKEKKVHVFTMAKEFVEKLWNSHDS